MSLLFEILNEYVAIASIEDQPKLEKPFGESIDEALQYMLKTGSEWGFKTHNLDGLTGLIEYGDAEEAVGILVHCDVVPAGKGWDYDPYKLTHVDGKLYGRGTIDNKGPAVACLYAMKQMKDAGINPKRKVQMIIGTDEETLWRGIERFIKHEKLPVVSFTPDGNFPLIHAEKGILDINLSKDDVTFKLLDGIELLQIKGGMSRNSVADTCCLKFFCNPDLESHIEKIFEKRAQDHGLKCNFSKQGRITEVELLGKSAHAMHPDKGINAITHGMMALFDMSMNDPVLNDFEQSIGLDIYGEYIKCHTEDNISGKLTLNVGQVTYDAMRLEFRMNVRYPVTLNPESISDQFARAFYNSVYEYAEVDHLKPLYIPRDHPVIETLMGVYQEHTNDNETEPMVIGGGTYARVLPNTIAFGPVFPWQEEIAHEANEFIEEAHLLQLVDIYKDAIRKLTEMELDQ